MQFSIATNWDSELLERLVGTSVTSLYGQIWSDPLGGGRMALFLPKVDRKRAESFVAKAHEKGFSFNYLMNASCFDNWEFMREGYSKIMGHLEWITSTGADIVTISLPFLLQLVKREFPHLKVAVSSFARVANVNLARYWEDLGADKIILPEIMGRDFEGLRLVREGVRCELELIANHSCLFYCPLDLHHRNMVSHASQEGHGCGGFAADYCKLSCQRMKLIKPAELIRARWIRPEDVGVYEEMGIDCLKLVERFRGTESLMNILNAYERRSYPGNLGDLLTLPQEGAYMSPNMHMLQRPDLIDPEMIEEVLSVLREPFTGKVYIDNEKLEGFIDYFRDVNCFHADCEACGYCEQIASRVVSMDEKWRKDLVQSFDRALGILMNGGLAGRRAVI